MILSKMGEWLRPEPLSALACPIGAGAAALCRRNLGVELTALAGQSNRTLLMTGPLLWELARAGDGAKVIVLRRSGGVAGRPVGIATGLLAGRFGSRLKLRDELGGTDEKESEANRYANFRHESGSQRWRTPQTPRPPSPFKSPNHTPIGECLGPGAIGDT